MASRRWYSFGPEVTAWIEANCVLPSGEHIGRSFRLMPWQKDWINELYACDAKGTLHYRWILLGIECCSRTAWQSMDRIWSASTRFRPVASSANCQVKPTMEIKNYECH